MPELGAGAAGHRPCAVRSWPEDWRHGGSRSTRAGLSMPDAGSWWAGADATARLCLVAIAAGQSRVRGVGYAPPMSRLAAVVDAREPFGAVAAALRDVPAEVRDRLIAALADPAAIEDAATLSRFVPRFRRYES